MTTKNFQARQNENLSRDQVWEESKNAAIRATEFYTALEADLKIWLELPSSQVKEETLPLT